MRLKRCAPMSCQHGCRRKEPLRDENEYSESVKLSEWKSASSRKRELVRYATPRPPSPQRSPAEYSALRGAPGGASRA